MHFIFQNFEILIFRKFAKFLFSIFLMWPVKFKTFLWSIMLHIILLDRMQKKLEIGIVRDNVRQFVFSSISGGPKVFVSKNAYILDCTLR